MVNILMKSNRNINNQTSTNSLILVAVFPHYHYQVSWIMWYHILRTRCEGYTSMSWSSEPYLWQWNVLYMYHVKVKLVWNGCNWVT